MKMLELAIRFATDAHAGIDDKTGRPSILHPLRVMQCTYLPDDHHRIVAVLHDTVEDTDTSLEDIRAKFGPEVAEAVDAVSRREGETYRAFIRRAREHPVGRIVKISDIHDNLTRPLPPSMRGIHKRYEKALEVLR